MGSLSFYPTGSQHPSCWEILMWKKQKAKEHTGKRNQRQYLTRKINHASSFFEGMYYQSNHSILIWSLLLLSFNYLMPTLSFRLCSLLSFHILPTLDAGCQISFPQDSSWKSILRTLSKNTFPWEQYIEHESESKHLKVEVPNSAQTPLMH